jgi:hypothetical protein
VFERAPWDQVHTTAPRALCSWINQIRPGRHALVSTVAAGGMSFRSPTGPMWGLLRGVDTQGLQGPRGGPWRPWARPPWKVETVAPPLGVRGLFTEEIPLRVVRSLSR